MNKKIIIGSIVLVAILVGGFYYYRSQKIAQPKEIVAQDIAVFFNYAQEQLPTLTSELETAQKESPQDEAKINKLKETLKTYKIAQAIARKDLKTLENATSDELQFKGGQIWVEGDRFKDTMEGKLSSRILGGKNAIAFILFHSAMDKTQEEKDKTIAMLKIVFAKKLDPNTQAGEVFWVKNKATDTTSFDYVALFSLPEAAALYSFPQAQQLLNDYIKNFKRD